MCATLFLRFCLWSRTTFVVPSTTKIFKLVFKLEVSFISLLLKEISAADGSVQLPEPPWPLVTYINPLSLMGLSVFKVQVERRLPSQPVVLNFHIPNREVCEFYVHEHT